MKVNEKKKTRGYDGLRFREYQRTKYSTTKNMLTPFSALFKSILQKQKGQKKN